MLINLPLKAVMNTHHAALPKFLQYMQWACLCTAVYCGDLNRSELIKAMSQQQSITKRNCFIGLAVNFCGNGRHVCKVNTRVVRLF